MQLWRKSWNGSATIGTSLEMTMIFKLVSKASRYRVTMDEVWFIKSSIGRVMTSKFAFRLKLSSMSTEPVSKTSSSVGSMLRCRAKFSAKVTMFIAFGSFGVSFSARFGMSEAEMQSSLTMPEFMLEI